MSETSYIYCQCLKCFTNLSPFPVPGNHKLANILTLLFEECAEGWDMLLVQVQFILTLRIFFRVRSLLLYTLAEGIMSSDQLRILNFVVKG